MMNEAYYQASRRELQARRARESDARMQAYDARQNARHVGTPNRSEEEHSAHFYMRDTKARIKRKAISLKTKVIMHSLGVLFVLLTVVVIVLTTKNVGIAIGGGVGALVVYGMSVFMFGHHQRKKMLRNVMEKARVPYNPYSDFTYDKQAHAAVNSHLDAMPDATRFSNYLNPIHLRNPFMRQKGSTTYRMNGTAEMPLQ